MVAILPTMAERRDRLTALLIGPLGRKRTGNHPLRAAICGLRHLHRRDRNQKLNLKRQQQKGLILWARSEDIREMKLRIPKEIREYGPLMRPTQGRRPTSQAPQFLVQQALETPPSYETTPASTHPVMSAATGVQVLAHANQMPHNIRDLNLEIPLSRLQVEARSNSVPSPFLCTARAPVRNQTNFSLVQSMQATPVVIHHLVLDRWQILRPSGLSVADKVKMLRHPQKRIKASTQCALPIL